MPTSIICLLCCLESCFKPEHVGHLCICVFLWTPGTLATSLVEANGDSVNNEVNEHEQRKEITSNCCGIPQRNNSFTSVFHVTGLTDKL